MVYQVFLLVLLKYTTSHNMKNIILLFFVSFLLPIRAFAAFEGAQGLIMAAGGIVSKTIPVVVGLALLYFFWGLSKFILRAGDEKAREEGKQIMLWGVIALFVMVSIWGIVDFIARDLGVKGGVLWTGENCPDGSTVCA